MQSGDNVDKRRFKESDVEKYKRNNLRQYAQ